MIQHSLETGILVTWTKSFNCPDVVNKDAVQLLKDALARRADTRVNVVAVLNDTTGTLLQGATQDPHTAMGLILGTGSNACYLERADKVEHWEPERHGEREVIILLFILYLQYLICNNRLNRLLLTWNGVLLVIMVSLILLRQILTVKMMLILFSSIHLRKFS